MANWEMTFFAALAAYFAGRVHGYLHYQDILRKVTSELMMDIMNKLSPEAKDEFTKAAFKVKDETAEALKKLENKRLW